MTDTHREIERKLRVPALYELPTLASLEGVTQAEGQPTVTLLNNYVDTPDLRLFRWGITLRRRDGGSDEGWHVKIPVAESNSGARDEIRAPWQPELPDDLRQLLTAFVREAEPEPLVTLRTERTPYLLRDETGTLRAELVDDSVSVLSGDRTVSTFREIEVEAVPDSEGHLDEDFVDRVAEALTHTGAVPSKQSKAAAALGPRALAPPDVPIMPWPSAKDSSGDVVHAFLAHHVRHLILEDLRMRRHLPDAVHQMRVSARRLRSGLKAFKSLLDPEIADRLRGELAWMAASLGAARDAEVLQERLDRHADRLPERQGRLARAVIDPALESQAAAAAREAEAMLESLRYRELLVSLVAVAQRPPLSIEADQPADEVLPRLLRKATGRLDKAINRLTQDGPAEPWHEARIVAKRARYVADACAPVLGKRVQTLAARLAEVTDLLGTHHDAHVAQATLEELAAGADGRAGFALGALQQVEIDAEMADRRSFSKMWPKVARAIRRDLPR